MGRNISISAKKNRALLAILALSPGLSSTRERLAGLLWGDRQDEQARSSLRQALAVLRKELGDTDEQILQAKDDVLKLSGEAVHVDGVEFLKLTKADDVASLRKAADLYRGELLADFSGRDEGLEAWLSIERARFRHEAIKLLERLSQQENVTAAVEVSRRLVELDSLREPSYRICIQALMNAGDRMGARKCFDEFSAILLRELGAAPSFSFGDILQLGVTPDRGVASPSDSSGPDVSPRRENVARVTVMPFVNLSGDPEQDFLADGLAEDIITDLVRLRRFEVTARGSAFALRHTPTDIVSVAQKFRSTHVLEGSVRRLGTRFRLSVQLSDGRTGTQVWAHRYERTTDDILNLQSEVASKICDSLNVVLVINPQSHLNPSFVAYESFLKGRHQLHIGTKRSLDIAKKHFAMAISLDRAFAAAYASLALAHARLKSWHGVEVELEELSELASNALRLDERLAEAHVVLGVVAACQIHPTGVSEHFDKALTLDQNSFDAHFFLAWHSFNIKDFETAERHYRVATELLPNDFRSPIYLRSVLRLLGRKDDSESFARIGLQRAERAMLENPAAIDAALLGACVLAELGQRDKAVSWTKSFLASAQDDTLALYNAACVYSILREHSISLEMLQRWILTADLQALSWCNSDPDLKSVRETSGFLQLMETRLAILSEL